MNYVTACQSNEYRRYCIRSRAEIRLNVICLGIILSRLSGEYLCNKYTPTFVNIEIAESQLSLRMIRKLPIQTFEDYKRNIEKEYDNLLILLILFICSTLWDQFFGTNRYKCLTKNIFYFY